VRGRGRVAGFPPYDGFMYSVGRRVATIGALLLVAGCGGVEPPPTAPARETVPGPVENLAARVILIGDAGAPAARRVQLQGPGVLPVVPRPADERDHG
jgi:hypothetical protein